MLLDLWSSKLSEKDWNIILENNTGYSKPVFWPSEFIHFHMPNEFYDFVNIIFAEYDSLILYRW
jgi:hypothetical protein